MFAETTLKGEPITAEYARQRISMEPVAEITQFKGDSETHPTFSPEDEFADFETYKFYIQQTYEEYKESAADYIRPALLRGLSIEEKVGVNPYKFGLIGSTDAHTGLSSAEEANFWGKMARDSVPENKRSKLMQGGKKSVSGWNMSAQGLAAVWARDNNREDIYAAFKRKEVYATTGPRIAVQVFAGWQFTAEDVDSKNFADIGYAKGVPMGSDFTHPENNTSKAQLLIRAVKDPKGANLDRVQVVKGWLDVEGKQREKVFNVAWSDSRQMDAAGKIATVGNTVNESTASYVNNIGEAAFSVLWTDPEFNHEQRAFYYVRVLQIPTPRHSLYDAVALQIEAPDEGPASIQERAYTSPIWYTP